MTSKSCLWFLVIVLFISCKQKKPTYNEVIESAQIVEEESAQNIKVKVEEVVGDTEVSNTESAEKLNEISQNQEDLQTEPKLGIPKKVKVTEVEKVPKKIIKRGVMSYDSYVFEFGEINEGDIVNHNFYFTNTGNAPINVKGSTATCGCTTPSYPFLPIGPGEKGYVGVTFNSTGKFGKQTPTVTVVSDAKEKVVKLKLTGSVIPKKELKIIRKEEVVDTLSKSSN